MHHRACVRGGVGMPGRSKGGTLLGAYKGQVHWKERLDPGYFEWLS